jgi:hypothetical protein
MTAADYEMTVRWAAARKAFGYLRAPSVCIRLHGPQASGSSYVADGRDLIDYLDILEKFVLPENWDLLQGYQGSIVRHLAWRTDYCRQQKGAGVSVETARRVDELTRRLHEIPHLHGAEGVRDHPLISVIVRVGTLPQLLASLASLAAQEDAPAWEAVVVAENGPDYGALLRVLPEAARIRYVRMDERHAPAAARNLGQRLAAGRYVTYLEPGTTYAPRHLAALAQAFADGAIVARTDVRFLLAEAHDGTPNTVFRETVVAGLFRGAGDEDRDLIAATVPADAIAHERGTIERTGPFRPDLPVGEVWEYWLRLRSLGGAVFVPGPTVDVRTLRQSVLPDPAYVGLAQSIYRAYPAPEGSPLGQRRAAYLTAVAPHFERGAAAIVDEMKAVEVLAALLGIENAVMTATRT